VGRRRTRRKEKRNENIEPIEMNVELEEGKRGKNEAICRKREMKVVEEKCNKR
jgi:hypothetical protein